MKHSGIFQGNMKGARVSPKQIGLNPQLPFTPLGITANMGRCIYLAIWLTNNNCNRESATSEKKIKNSIINSGKCSIKNVDWMVSDTAFPPILGLCICRQAGLSDLVGSLLEFYVCNFQ